MKFLPVKEGNAAILMRLPVRRLSLKVYIENTMIPDIIAYEGSEFLSSLFWGAQHFVCDLYNGVWEQYAQKRPFNISIFGYSTLSRKNTRFCTSKCLCYLDWRNYATAPLLLPATSLTAAA